MCLGDKNLIYLRTNIYNEPMLTASNCGVSNRASLSPLAQATLEKHLPGLPTKLFLQQNKTQKRDVGCSTDMCSSEYLPEVEIFSLLEEQIPKYKIRADSMTQFAGYENQDWVIPCPALPIPTDGLGLTKDQIRETLNYFLLCGNRVSQMTRTYDDIDAVTRLLEEKEKDLELTVQIGKELLQQNNRLELKVHELENDLRITNENLSQIQHELHQKSDLICILTNDCDDSNSESNTPTASKSINLDLMQTRIKSLENENRSLRTEAFQLSSQTDEVEEQERKLMADIMHQLQSANNQFDGTSLELERQKEENRYQHEQIINLTTRLADAEMRLHQITAENEEQSSVLSITKENQDLLAGELSEFKVRYQEVLALLQETQEQLRRQRKRAQPMVRSSIIPALGAAPLVDSLQSELMETSLYSDNSLDSGIASDRGGIAGLGMGTVPGYKKVFETVRCVAKTNTFADSTTSQLGAMSMSSSSQPRMSSFATGTTNSSSARLYQGPSSVYSSSMYPSYDSSMGAKTYSTESLISDAEDSYPSQASVGVPGAPGAKDLEAALKRLTPAEVLSRRAMLQHAPAGTYNYDEGTLGIPLGCRTPDSIMSTGSSGLSGMSSSNQWRLPEKLQIVKPMEGSQTLHHWSRLATPTLSGLLDERPGVTIRGGRGLDELGLQMYSLSDVEEDAEDYPGKRFQPSGCIYTFTNSTVMHPDDGTSVTSSMPPSQMSSHVASVCSSRHTTAPPTPRACLSRRNSCSTFSVNMGLASMLNERGIKAVTPSALNTPSGPNYTPTVTPCNSPEGSPPGRQSPEHFLGGFFSSGADMVRRKFVGTDSLSTISSGDRTSRTAVRNKITLSRLEKRALRSINLLEKVESIGIDNIIAPSSISPLALHSTSSGNSMMYTSMGRSNSPMAQLTSLKKFGSQDGTIKYIDRETMKFVLSKGFSNESIKSLSDSSCSDISATSTDSGLNKKESIRKDESSSRPVPPMGVPSQPATGAADARLKQMQRQKSRRNLLNGGGGQRPDLGTVGNGNNNKGNVKAASVRRDLGTVGGSSSSAAAKTSANLSPVKLQNEKQQQAPQPMGFVGTISSLLFGRKGGFM